MRNILLTLTAAALAACATVEEPAEYGAAQCIDPGKIDRDDDGIVEIGEWNAYRINSFIGWDLTPDGRIDPNEFAACWHAARFASDADVRTRGWTAFDADRDNRLDRDEFFSSGTWARLDADGDGRIENRSESWPW